MNRNPVKSSSFLSREDFTQIRFTKVQRFTLEALRMIPELLTPAQLAKTLKVSKQAVYAWVEKGAIPFYRLEKLIRFDPGEIKEWVRERHNAARKPGAAPGDKVAGATT